MKLTPTSWAALSRVFAMVTKSPRFLGISAYQSDRSHRDLFIYDGNPVFLLDGPPVGTRSIMSQTEDLVEIF